MTTNNKIRKDLRLKRQNLSIKQQQIASEELCEQLIQHKSFKHSKNIACYLATQGELSLMPFIYACWQHKKNIFLPVLQKSHQNSLWFVPFNINTTLINNRYGILEPKHTNKQRNVKIIHLDSIFVPLVAFDLNGNRLGMGAGYYDRTLNNLKSRQKWFKPRLIGVGYDFQQVKNIKTNPWDIPMHFISTDKALHRVKN